MVVMDVDMREPGTGDLHETTPAPTEPGMSGVQTDANRRVKALQNRGEFSRSPPRSSAAAETPQPDARSEAHSADATRRCSRRHQPRAHARHGDAAPDRLDAPPGCRRPVAAGHTRHGPIPVTRNNPAEVGGGFRRLHREQGDGPLLLRESHRRSDSTPKRIAVRHRVIGGRQHDDIVRRCGKHGHQGHQYAGGRASICRLKQHGRPPGNVTRVQQRPVGLIDDDHGAVRAGEWSSSRERHAEERLASGWTKELLRHAAGHAGESAAGTCGLNDGPDVRRHGTARHGTALAVHECCHREPASALRQSSSRRAAPGRSTAGIFGSFRCHRPRIAQRRCACRQTHCRRPARPVGCAGRPPAGCAGPRRARAGCHWGREHTGQTHRRHAGPRHHRVRVRRDCRTGAPGIGSPCPYVSPRRDACPHPGPDRDPRGRWRGDRCDDGGDDRGSTTATPCADRGCGAGRGTERLQAPCGTRRQGGVSSLPHGGVPEDGGQGVVTATQPPRTGGGPAVIHSRAHRRTPLDRAPGATAWSGEQESHVLTERVHLCAGPDATGSSGSGHGQWRRCCRPVRGARCRSPPTRHPGVSSSWP